MQYAHAHQYSSRQLQEGSCSATGSSRVRVRYETLSKRMVLETEPPKPTLAKLSTPSVAHCETVIDVPVALGLSRGDMVLITPLENNEGSMVGAVHALVQNVDEPGTRIMVFAPYPLPAFTTRVHMQQVDDCVLAVSSVPTTSVWPEVLGLNGMAIACHGTLKMPNVQSLSHVRSVNVAVASGDLRTTGDSLTQPRLQTRLLAKICTMPSVRNEYSMLRNITLTHPHTLHFIGLAFSNWNGMPYDFDGAGFSVTLALRA